MTASEIRTLLTPRQLAVLAEYATGSGQKETATNLHLSLNNVKKNMAEAVWLLNAHNSTHAVAMLVAAGVIP